MINQYKFIVVLLSLSLFQFSCGHSHSHDQHEDHAHQHTTKSEMGSEEEEHGENEVHLTKVQIQTIGLTTGSFQPIKISGFMKANGIMDLPPDEIATVTAPARGFVLSTKGEYLVGSYVKKGAILATLEHPDYLSLQQNYMDVVAQLEYQEQEVERQQKLSEANAGALKKYQEASSTLKRLTAQSEGLKGQLRYLGLNPEQVEEGTISSSINLIAPISGYITKLDINQGRFVEPEEMLYEIVNNKHVHLELDVFERDIAKVKEKMRITFSVPSLGNEIFEGEVRLVGRSFNMENKTVRVHGHIEGKHPSFIRGLYVEAKIWSDNETVNALPSGAVVSSEGLAYIFVPEPSENPEELHFKRIPVKLGVSSKDFVEVKPLEVLPDSTAIVTSQAYFLASQMIKGELEHEH